MSTSMIDFTESLPVVSPETAEKKYRSMIRAVAAGRRHECDPSITEASGRFAVDCESDLEKARRRVRAVADIEAAHVEIKRLAEIVPTPRPNASDLVEAYPTVGELGMALYATQNPHAAWGPTARHEQQQRDAKSRISVARNFLRFSADKDLDRKSRDARGLIAKVGRDHADLANLESKRADLLAKINGMRVVTEEEKSSAVTLRREYAKLGKRIAAAHVPDVESTAKLAAEIAAAEASELDPAQLEFSKPSMEAVR